MNIQKFSQHKKIFFLSVMSFLLASSLAQANTQTKPQWDTWYIVTVNGNVPYAYYNEKFEMKEGRIHLQMRIWKKEEGFINEENIGAFSKSGAELQPLLYTYQQKYKAVETTIDASFNDKGQLTLNIREPGKAPNPVQKQIPPKTILSYMFPLWLAQKLPSLQEGKIVSFLALAEDRIKEGFPVSVGQIILQKNDEIANKTKTRKIKVTFDDASSFWWVDSAGQAVAIDTPARKVLVQRVPQQKAEGFLK